MIMEKAIVQIINRYYNGTPQRYTKENVAAFVKAGKITAKEYESIVGEPYKEK